MYYSYFFRNWISIYETSETNENNEQNIDHSFVHCILHMMSNVALDLHPWPPFSSTLTWNDITFHLHHIHISYLLSLSLITVHCSYANVYQVVLHYYHFDGKWLLFVCLMILCQCHFNDTINFILYMLRYRKRDGFYNLIVQNIFTCIMWNRETFRIKNIFVAFNFSNAIFDFMNPSNRFWIYNWYWNSKLIWLLYSGVELSEHRWL